MYGEFGAGAGAQAFYLQSAISPAQLNMVSLISDIPGSERWPVRDLFQRDVNVGRITGALLPYLQNTGKIKFFNPLTLTLLPMDESGTSVLTTMPTVIRLSETEDGERWEGLERKGFYRVRWVKDSLHFAEIAWNDLRSKLVAIDGQHRLSALKRYLRDERSNSYEAFLKWRIPVVIVSFSAGADAADAPSVLEVVRSIFVYINTEAKEVNEARKILLSDESVNSVCAQELLDRSHRNDLDSSGDRDRSRLPLLFYDWRGEEKEKRDLHAPAAVKSVEEIRNWFAAYILGDDFTDDQEVALGLTPTDSLHGAFHDARLSFSDSNKLRLRIREELLPAVAHLLERFVPYESYVTELRELEAEYEGQAQLDLARHAFYELRFGTNRADDSVKPGVSEILEVIKQRVDKTKRAHLHRPIDLDVGMRGVVCAFGELRRRLGNPPWQDYARWFTQGLNAVYEEGWLDLRDGAARRGFLRHIVEAHDQEIVNYRLKDVNQAIGAYLMMFVAAYGRPWPDSWDCEERTWEHVREGCLDALHSTLLRGYRKENRWRLREDYPLGGKELTKAVNVAAGKDAGKHVRRIEREIDKIDSRQESVMVVDPQGVAIRLRDRENLGV